MHTKNTLLFKAWEELFYYWLLLEKNGKVKKDG